MYTLTTLIHRLKRFTVNKLLDFIVYMNGDHVSCDSETDTAELSDDRRRMVINFVFCGQKHKIELGYENHALEPMVYDIFDEDGHVIVTEQRTSIPGLERVLFSRDNLKLMYGKRIGQIDSREADD